MATPFVSHDGTDANGVRAEVYVQKGTGTVKGVEERNKGNVLVKMNVEGLKHPVQGWTNTKEPIYAAIVEAMNSGREISYRIESQRKKDIDRTIPIADLRQKDVANDNVTSLFVGIDGALSSEAVTDPAEDPAEGGRIPATAQRQQAQPAPAATGGGFSAEQALTGLANARQGGLPQTIVDATAALALAAGASVQQVMSAGVTEQSDPERRPVQRVRAAEAAPHVAYNTDGHVNLGSYAMQAAAGAESLAADLLHQDAVEAAERHNADLAARRAAGETTEDDVAVQPVNFKQAAALGAVLLDLADRVQVAAYGGGRANRMAASHTRARALVYDAVKHRHPVPFGQDSEAQEAWKTLVVEEAVDRFQRIIHVIAGEPEQQTPQQAPQQTPAAAQSAPTAQEGQEAQVRRIGTEHAAKPVPPVEGEEGFVPPTDETLKRFGALATSAGFDATPDSPVQVYLTHKFRVNAARKVDGASLATLVEWYEKQGEAGPTKFRQHVLAEAGEPASA